MTITPEEIAALADGELSGEQADRVAAAIRSDPLLQRQFDAHRLLKQSLAAHFAPMLEQPLPPRLTASLTASETGSGDPIGAVIDLAEVRTRRKHFQNPSTWRWGGGAIAASLVLGVGLLTFDNLSAPHQGYADTRLASLLDETLVASQSSAADRKILLSFSNGEGELCRAYLSPPQSGIACRDDTGWRIDETGSGKQDAAAEYRMASSAAVIIEAAQEMAVGNALTAEEEADARRRGWRN